MTTTKREVEGLKYELVKTDITGCANCCFIDRSEACDIVGTLCFKDEHGNDYPMVWKEVKK